MTPLLALAFFAQRVEPKGEFETELVAESERLLAAFDVPGPYIVEFVGSNRESNETTRTTSCRLRAADGLHYHGFLRNATGRFALTSERKRQGGSEKRETGSQTPDAQRARAKALMERAGSPYPLLPLEDEYAIFAWKSTEDCFSFPIAIQGQRFLHPRLGYGVTLDAKTGEFRGFTAPDIPPSVGDPTPQLTRTNAITVARRLLVGDPPQKYVNRRMKPWIDYTVDPDSIWPNQASFLSAPVRLGWFVPKGEGVARLTWNVPYWENHHGTGGTQMSLLPCVVDAITSERLPSEGLSGII